MHKTSLLIIWNHSAIVIKSLSIRIPFPAESFHIRSNSCYAVISAFLVGLMFFFDLLRNSIADEELILINHRSVIIFMALCSERRDFASDFTLQAFHAGFQSLLTMKGRKKKETRFCSHSVLEIVQFIFKIYLSEIGRNLFVTCARQTTNKYHLIKHSLYFLSKDTVKDLFWNRSVRLPL